MAHALESSAYSTPNKVLLMGRAKAGKTSMKSIIFANYMAKDTERLGPTIRIAHSTLRFLGNLQLDLWDCGGQERFLASYFDSNRERIFSNVAVLIYVLDVVSLLKQKRSPDANDLLKFENTCAAVSECSPSAQIFVLIHKMDTVPVAKRESVFEEWQTVVRKKARSCELTALCFATSIWDESLFAAWSQIVCSLLPDAAKVDEELQALRAKSGAHQMVLFEASTLLFVKSATEHLHEDEHQPYRFEQIVNVVKQLRLRCHESLIQYSTIRVSNQLFTAYLGPFTPSTCILVVVTNPKVQMDAALLNVAKAKPRFARLLSMHSSHIEGDTHSALI